MKKHTVILFILGLLTAGGFTDALRAAEPPALYLLPFRVIAPDRDLETMIGKSIDAFLTSRLSGDTCTLKHVPADTPSVPAGTTPTPEEAHAVLEALNGQVLIYGTVIRLGDTLSTDAFVYDRASRRLRLHVHDIGSGDGALLDHLTRFTDQVTALFTPPAMPDPAGSAPPTAPRQPVFSSVSAWKSAPLGDAVTGLVICDLDRDGKPDLITAHDHGLRVFSLAADRITPTRDVALPADHHVVGLDQADLDADGNPELYVSILGADRHTIASRVLTFTGSSFETRASDLPWLFRRLDRANGEPAAVLAQKNDGLNALLGGPVVFYDPTSAPESLRPLPLPQTDINLFSLTATRDVRGTHYALYAFNHRLRVHDDTMALTWESDGDYGGSDRFMAMDDPHDRDKTLHLYLEPRLIFRDLDGDGQNELISIANTETANHLFSGFRHYSRGRIDFLKRKDFGFAPVFETETVTGSIADLALTDLDGDGRPELVYAVNQPGKGLFAKPTAVIVVQAWRIY
ncbi:hypothetical protein JCM14469_18400 [Desulfatiferula olefinivorans]